MNIQAASGADNVLSWVKQTYVRQFYRAGRKFFSMSRKPGISLLTIIRLTTIVFGNAVLDTDKLENSNPVKRKQT